jgi:hypothetical protein
MKCLNEQKAVKRCIGDFHDEPWVDDIIVIDGGSSDFTVQELKQFPKVRVFRHEYLCDYHDAEITQANIMASYIPQGDIFFSLDFDEKCSPELKQFLAEVDEKDELPEGADLVHIPRRTVEVMRHPNSPYAILGPDQWPLESHVIGQWPDYQPRLMRRSPYLRWIQSPHRILIGYEKNHNLEGRGHIEHFEKEDKRDRDWIERRWLRPNATRKALGLPCDLYEAGVKPEYAEAADPEFWKDR